MITIIISATISKINHSIKVARLDRSLDTGILNFSNRDSSLENIDDTGHAISSSKSYKINNYEVCISNIYIQSTIRARIFDDI